MCFLKHHSVTVNVISWLIDSHDCTLCDLGLLNDCASWYVDRQCLLQATGTVQLVCAETQTIWDRQRRTSTRKDIRENFWSLMPVGEDIKLAWSLREVSCRDLDHIVVQNLRTKFKLTGENESSMFHCCQVRSLQVIHHKNPWTARSRSATSQSSPLVTLTLLVPRGFKLLVDAMNSNPPMAAPDPRYPKINYQARLRMLYSSPHM